MSGEGGSCFYRAIAYQICERQHVPYDDLSQVLRLRTGVRNFLHQNTNQPVPTDPQLKWRDLGHYTDGYAEAPVPQAMAYVVRCPVTVHLGVRAFTYGSDMVGTPLHVRLAGEHYSIEYPILL